MITCVTHAPKEAPTSSVSTAIAGSTTARNARATTLVTLVAIRALAVSSAWVSFFIVFVCYRMCWERGFAFISELQLSVDGSGIPPPRPPSPLL